MNNSTLNRALVLVGSIALIVVLISVARCRRIREPGGIALGPATVSAQADASWIPVVKQLAEKGLADPALLVFILNNCEIELPTGRFEMGGGFPRSLSTVAAALGSDVKTVERAYIDATARRSDAAKLISAARTALPEIRTALPQARVGDRLFVLGSDPVRVADFTRYIAKHDGISLPPPRVSAEWKDLIRAAPRGDTQDAQALFLLTRYRKVTLASGKVAEALEEDDAYVTVAEALGLEPRDLQAECARLFAAASLITGPNYAKSAVDLERRFTKLPGVTAVERLPETFPQTIVAKRTVDGSSPRAPWQVFGEEPESLRWRMGPGEDLMTMWHGYWASLRPDERQAYLSERSPPPAWRKWLDELR